MRSGQLAAAAGVNAQTLRYYERRGLLPEPRRSVGGYREYDEGALALPRVVKSAQRLGFTVDEVAGLLEAGRHRHPSPDPRQRARAKLAVPLLVPLGLLSVGGVATATTGLTVVSVLLLVAAVVLWAWRARRTWAAARRGRAHQRCASNR